MGYTVNFVSYSLLTDFITDFFRNGVTMRGFYASYESKCIMKYGMKEYELISWRAWHSGCNEFMNKIFDINQREAFSCISLLYDNAPNHELRNYCVRVGDEELTHVYPNFPLWRERELYNIDSPQFLYYISHYKNSSPFDF